MSATGWPWELVLVDDGSGEPTRRELEALARGKKQRKKAPRKRRTEDPVLREWEERLQRSLGTQVRIEQIGHEGSIRIEYYSDEDLERILEALGRLG